MSELRAVCFDCGSLTLNGRIDGKFYYNTETTAYYCHHCQIKGKDLPQEILEELQVIDEIIKKPFNQTALSLLVPNHPKLDAFLAERGLRASDQLMYSPNYDAVAIPVYGTFDCTSISGIKYRKLDPEAKPRYLSEPGSVNEGYWIKGTDSSKLLIVEGELDALTAFQCGFNGAILATQTNRVAESQTASIKAFKSIFVCPDKDLGGVELENSIQSLLRGHRGIVTVTLPEGFKDLNELLQKGGQNECSEFIRIQTQTAIERDTRNYSQSVPELLTWLSDDRHRTGDSSGWPALDQVIGKGFRTGEMSVINSFAKVGKSSFVNNLIHNLARNNKKIALASFEMPPHAIYTSLLSIAMETNIRELSNEDRDAYVQGCLEESRYLDNIITLKRFGYTPWNEIEEWARHCKEKYQIDYLVLDHAGFMVENMTDAEENQTLAKNIKKLTNTLEISIFVVVQAPKSKDGLSIQTAYGGMAWSQNCDNFFILERDKENESLLKVRLEAARYPGCNPSSQPIHLFYDRETLKLNQN